MGLFDDLISGVVGLTGGNINPITSLVSGVAGVATAVTAPIEAVAGVATKLIGTPVDLISEVASVIPVVAGVAGIASGGARGGVVDTTGFGGGNGQFATRTIVETMNTMTGQIVSRKVLPGSPHLMNSEIRAAKKVFRQVRKLDARLPRKTVKTSKTKQLTDAAVDQAIRNVTGPGSCPS